MRFPKALKAAVVVGSKVYFKQSMTDKELIEVLQWRFRNNVEGGITAKVLVKMYARNLYRNEIKAIFKKSNKIDMLASSFLN